jgi:hypothetical protein
MTIYYVSLVSRHLTNLCPPGTYYGFQVIKKGNFEVTSNGTTPALNLIKSLKRFSPWNVRIHRCDQVYVRSCKGRIMFSMGVILTERQSIICCCELQLHTHKDCVQLIQGLPNMGDITDYIASFVLSRRKLRLMVWTSVGFTSVTNEFQVHRRLTGLTTVMILAVFNLLESHRIINVEKRNVMFICNNAFQTFTKYEKYTRFNVFKAVTSCSLVDYTGSQSRRPQSKWKNA